MSTRTGPRRTAAAQWRTNSLDKRDVVKEFGSKAGLTRQRSLELVDMFLAIVQEGLTHDGEVAIRGFGRFYASKTHMRVVPDRKTGKRRWTKPRPTVRFQPRAGLLAAVADRPDQG